jgi:hypothetical protein
MRKLVDSLHALMPDSTLSIFQGARYLLPLTHSAQLAEVLISHLRSEAAHKLR